MRAADRLITASEGHFPLLIAAGLLIVTLACWWPAAPAITAMALLAWGATVATLDRFRASHAVVPILLVHLAIYGGLYLLFVGAMLDKATQTGTQPGFAAAFDLAMSLGPIVIAARLAARGLSQARWAE